MGYQQTKALLNEKALEAFVTAKLQTLGTSACPPYHIALVVGGTSAEACLKTVKLASARYYDDLPTSGSAGGRAFRDLKWEAKVLKICQDLGVGAQFGGKYFAHDVRVVRLPRHGASCPVGLGVSCSADRQILAKITAEGVLLEQLEHEPSRFLVSSPSDLVATPAEVVSIDLELPMEQILATLTKYPIKTRLKLTGTLIVARDIARAKLNERLEATGTLPDYVPIFQPHGASLITLAKGNRSKQVTESCKANSGFYLGSIGGAAAVLSENCIKNVEVMEYEELGMEAIWKIHVVDFPAFIMVDDKGNDFFAKWDM